jgi:hypothetical protein
MKRRLAAILLMPLIMLTVGCNKPDERPENPIIQDTNCYLKVQVTDVVNGNPMQGVTVQTYTASCDSTDNNYRNGITDRNGVFFTSFASPAIINVKATLYLDTLRNGSERGYRTNETTVRLTTGNIRETHIYLPPDTLWVTGSLD